MQPNRSIVLMLAIAGMVAPTRLLARDPPQSQPTAQEVLTPEQEREIERQRLEQEAASLPVVRVESVEQAVKFSVEDGQLVAITSLTPVQGEVRVVHPDLPGVVRMRVMDLQAIGDVSSGRNFSFIQADLTQPGTVIAYTHVHAIAGRLNVARDAQSEELHWQVELVQDPPEMPGAVPDPDTQPVRLRVRRNSNVGEGGPLVSLDLGAPTFEELRRRHPREVETYLRPILRDLGQQDQTIFAVDERIAWQVLGGAHEPDPAAAERVETVLAKFDSPDFREREAALDELKKLGQPAAIVLARADRGGYSADQNAGVDEFLAEFLPLNESDVNRLRTSPSFLLDTLASEDPALRRLALQHLRSVTETPIEFDADAPREARLAQLQKLRAQLVRPAPTTGPTTAPSGC